MKEHVLLVAPYIHDFAAFDLWLKPLGLLYVAAAAERAGYTVRLINCLDRPHTEKSRTAPDRSSDRSNGTGKLLSETIAKPERLAGVPRTYKRYGIPPGLLRKMLADTPCPAAIGVSSMMTYWYGGVTETIGILREFWPDVPVILGGVYATLCPGHARRHAGADIVVEGPGEEKFLEILRAEVGPAGSSDARPESLRPAYHLLHNLDSVSMLTSFGCPFSCAYCASRFLRTGFRQRPGRDVVEEIVYYARNMNIRNIAFYDDALLINAERHIKPILRNVIERGLDIRFHTPNGLHADLIDKQLATLMRDSGFATVRLSVESINAERLKDSCMKVTMQGFEAAVSHLFDAGYAPGEIEAYVMMGAPGQEPEEVERTMRFVHATGVVIRLADFSPIPKTPYFETAIEAYGLDSTEPLLQNSSALPHLVPGLYQQYEELKKLAGTLNSTLRARAEDPGRNE